MRQPKGKLLQLSKYPVQEGYFLVFSHHECSINSFFWHATITRTHPRVPLRSSSSLSFLAVNLDSSCGARAISL